MNSDKLLEKINLNIKRCLEADFYFDKLIDSKKKLDSISEIEALPLTFKSELQKAGVNGRLATPMRNIVEYHESFGTTGIPISTMLTKNDFSQWANQISECAVDFSENDIVLVRFPYAISDPAHIVQAAAKEAGACVVPVSSRTFISPHRRVIDLLHKLKATVIGCMPLEAIMLGETAKLLGFDPKKDFPHLRAFCTAGELLSEKRKRYIEELWNVKVYNMYGTTETGNIASACNQGHLHVSSNHFYVEVLEPKNWKKVASGEQGILVVTTLTLEGMPLLRYVTGDIVTLLPVHKEHNCGKESDIICVYGRETEKIMANGNMLWPIEVQNAIYGNMAENMGAFWTVGSDGKGLLITCEAKEISLSEKCEQQISKELGCNVHLKLVEEGELFERSKLLDNTPVKKPCYMYPIADCSDICNYKRFDDVLEGYHVFR